ncbi:MAG: hypothetical protein M1837_002227 [Sclerophora amabilis]|nr:MAG: hypothetical protein M1837_002227 [Sclerophora amabilis]
MLVCGTKRALAAVIIWILATQSHCRSTPAGLKNARDSLEKRNLKRSDLAQDPEVFQQSPISVPIPPSAQTPLLPENEDALWTWDGDWEGFGGEEAARGGNTVSLAQAAATWVEQLLLGDVGFEATVDNHDNVRFFISDEDFAPGKPRSELMVGFVRSHAGSSGHNWPTHLRSQSESSPIPSSYPTTVPTHLFSLISNSEVHHGRWEITLVTGEVYRIYLSGYINHNPRRPPPPPGDGDLGSKNVRSFSGPQIDDENVEAKRRLNAINRGTTLQAQQEQDVVRRSAARTPVSVSSRAFDSGEVNPVWIPDREWEGLGGEVLTGTEEQIAQFAEAARNCLEIFFYDRYAGEYLLLGPGRARRQVGARLLFINDPQDSKRKRPRQEMIIAFRRSRLGSAGPHWPEHQRISDHLFLPETYHGRSMPSYISYMIHDLKKPYGQMEIPLVTNEVYSVRFSIYINRKPRAELMRDSGIMRWDHYGRVRSIDSSEVDLFDSEAQRRIEAIQDNTMELPEITGGPHIGRRSPVVLPHEKENVRRSPALSDVPLPPEEDTWWVWDGDWKGFGGEIATGKEDIWVANAAGAWLESLLEPSSAGYNGFEEAIRKKENVQFFIADEDFIPGRPRKELMVSFASSHNGPGGPHWPTHFRYRKAVPTELVSNDVPTLMAALITQKHRSYGKFVIRLITGETYRVCFSMYLNQSPRLSSFMAWQISQFNDGGIEFPRTKRFSGWQVDETNEEAKRRRDAIWLDSSLARCPTRRKSRVQKECNIQ